MLVLPVLSLSISITMDATEKQTGPIAIPVAPADPSIVYHGGTDVGYVPEPQLAPVGPQTLLVIIVEFSDQAGTETNDTFDDLIFGNVSDYYQKVSYGQSSLSGDVTDWYNLGHIKSFYGADGATSGVIDDTDDDGDNDSWQMVDDALAAADPDVDFSLYGHIMVLHSGNGQESSGNSNDIWSVRWSWPGHFVTDEKTFDSCSIVPEYQGGDVDRSIGVIAHEFGHDIGLPDLYHYGKSGADDLVGIWGLMASGSWGGSPSGTVPVHMTAYCKLVLDWYTAGEVYELSSGSHTSLLTASSNQTSGTRVIRYNVTSSYYYLVEARYQSGYDASLAESGVLVTRVDTNYASGEGIVQVRSDETSSLSYATFEVGTEFVDEVAGFAMQVLSQEGSGFVVRVTADPLDGWLSEHELSGDDYTQFSNPAMTTNSAGTIYCAYSELNSTSGYYQVRVKKSTDASLSWTHAFGFYSATGNLTNTDIAIDVYNDRVFVVYEYQSGTTYEVRLAQYDSTDTLIGFSTIASNARDPSIFIEYHAGSGNDIMIAYESWTGTSSSEIAIERSNDHGSSFFIQNTLSAMTFSVDPQIVGSYGFDGTMRFYVVYIEGDAMNNLLRVSLSRSDDYFTSFDTGYASFANTLSSPTVAAIRGAPTVIFACSINSGGSYNSDIIIYYSTDHGDSYTSNTLLYETTDDEKYPLLKADGNTADSNAKGQFYLSYYNGNDIEVRRIYYDRPSVLSSAHTVSSDTYPTDSGIAGTVHFAQSGYHPIVAWLSNDAYHSVVNSMSGYAYTIGANTPSLEIDVNGQTFTCPVDIEIPFGHSMTIEVIQYQELANSRYNFSHWTSNPFGINYTANGTIVVSHFDSGYNGVAESQFQWILEVVGDFTYTDSGWVDGGTNLTFSSSAPAANATTRFVFSHWSGNVSGTDASLSSWVIADQPIYAYAHWTTQYYLTIQFLPSDLTGMSSLTDQEDWFDADSDVTISAPSISGYTLVQWALDSEIHDGATYSTDVTMDTYHTLIAIYSDGTTTPTIPTTTTPTDQTGTTTTSPTTNTGDGPTINLPIFLSLILVLLIANFALLRRRR